MEDFHAMKKDQPYLLFLYLEYVLQFLWCKKYHSVVAWFCPEVPSSVGPCGYIGLPGAILRLTTSTAIYEATNILPTKEKVKIELPKGKIMQKQAFEKLQKKKIEELQSNDSGKGNVIVL